MDKLVQIAFPRKKYSLEKASKYLVARGIKYKNIVMIDKDWVFIVGVFKNTPNNITRDINYMNVLYVDGIKYYLHE